MEPPDSLLNREAHDAAVFAVLRAVEPGQERIVVRREGIVVLDLLGKPEELKTPALNQAQEVLVRDADVFHNHPLDTDGTGADRSFSTDDFYFARRLAPRRMVAVAQTVWFEAIRPAFGWRRALGSGAEWERDYRGFFALELSTGRSLDEARHEACARLCRTRRILYERRELT